MGYELDSLTNIFGNVRKFITHNSANTIISNKLFDKKSSLERLLTSYPTAAYTYHVHYCHCDPINGFLINYIYSDICVGFYIPQSKIGDIVTLQCLNFSSDYKIDKNNKFYMAIENVMWLQERSLWNDRFTLLLNGKICLNFWKLGIDIHNTTMRSSFISQKYKYKYKNYYYYYTSGMMGKMYYNNLKYHDVFTFNHQHYWATIIQRAWRRSKVSKINSTPVDFDYILIDQI